MEFDVLDLLLTAGLFFELLGFRRYADDKHASLMRNVGLRTLAVLGVIPLQEPSRHLQVGFGDGLWNRVSVLILLVGVGASMTERPEHRVKLVGHTAFVC